MTGIRKRNKSKKLARIASLDKLEYIRDNICNISEVRIKAAVDKLHKVEDVRNLITCFSEFDNIFAEESDNLRIYSKDYNNNYATDFNGGFDCALTTLNCIKKQVMFLYKLMNRTASKPTNLRGVYGDSNSIEFATSHSLLGSLPYQGSLFAERTDLQDRLINEITYFLDTLDKNLKLCCEQIEEEKRISSNNEEVIYRFRKQVTELYNIVKGSKSKKKVVEEPFYQDLVNHGEDPEKVHKWFHNITVSELAIVSQGIHENQMSEFDIHERMVFGEDASKIQRFRKAVQAVIASSLKITAKVIVYLMRYCDCWNISVRKKYYECFKDAYGRFGGKKHIPSYQAFNTKYSSVNIKEDTSDYNNFVIEIQKYA